MNILFKGKQANIENSYKTLMLSVKIGKSLKLLKWYRVNRFLNQIDSIMVYLDFSNLPV